MSSSFKSTVLNSFIWKLSEQVGVGSIQLIIGIVLARILLPEDYAILIIATVFIAISKVLIDSGLSSALIQKKEITITDTSSIFYLSLLISTVLYGIIFIIAPFIALLYDEPGLVLVLRVLGLTLFFGVISSMQNVFVSREFKFKTLFIVSLIAGLTSGIIGITLAFCEFGVWALVFQQLINAVVMATLLTLFIRWTPKITFSFISVKTLFSFGWKLLAASLIGQIYESVRNLSIGTFYSKSSLAYYNKGLEYPSYVCTGIDGAISAVLFPAYTKYQDDKTMLKIMLRRSVATSSFIVWPAMLGLAAIAPPFVELLLTDKWLLCVPFLQIFCLYNALQPISSSNLAAIKAIGRSDSLLRLEIIKRVVGFGILLCSLPFGVMAIAFGAVIFKIFSVIINTYPNKKYLEYKPLEMFKDILPFMGISTIMGCIVYSIQFIGLSPIITLCIQIPVGITVYLGLARLLHMKILEFIKCTVREYLKTYIK